MKLLNTNTRLLLLLAATLLAGCQPVVYMMPTPAAISAGELDPFTDTPEEERDSNIVVGYVTNRKPFGAKDARFYSRDFDEDLRMGTATIQIGDGEKSWDEVIEVTREGARKDEILLSLSQVEEFGVLKADEDPTGPLSDELQAMTDDFNDYIERSPLGDITVYVHGANNNFYRTAAQAAQYRHFTGRQAIVILYSWPSAESIVRYGTDIRNIRQTVPSFVRFIQYLSEHTSARKINILAYSAGATLTTEGLAVLGRDTSNPDRQAYKDSLRLGAVYFAAPDTDFDDWVDEYRSYHDIVDSVTVTINPNDKVLGIAQEDRRWKAYGGWDDYIHGSTTKSRLGRPDIDDISKQDALWLIEQSNNDNLDIIDIDPSSIPGLGKGDHDFWYSSPWVSTDALLDINLHAGPADRGLAMRRGEKGARIWYFPEDYENRVLEAINNLAKEYERLSSQSK
jgi:esterase/lipase superfamily enzyme